MRRPTAPLPARRAQPSGPSHDRLPDTRAVVAWMTPSGATTRTGRPRNAVREGNVVLVDDLRLGSARTRPAPPSAGRATPSSVRC